MLRVISVVCVTNHTCTKSKNWECPKHFWPFPNTCHSELFAPHSNVSRNYDTKWGQNQLSAKWPPDSRNQQIHGVSPQPSNFLLSPESHPKSHKLSANSDSNRAEELDLLFYQVPDLYHVISDRLLAIRPFHWARHRTCQPLYSYWKITNNKRNQLSFNIISMPIKMHSGKFSQWYTSSKLFSLNLVDICTKTDKITYKFMSSCMNAIFV